MECPDDNTLTRLAAGLVGDDERSAIEAHLDDCSSCAALIAELAALAVTDADDGDATAGLPPRYRIGQRLGQGASSIVLAAHDLDLGREVAIKILRPDLASDREQAAWRSRLMREARLLAQLSHPNVITVHDVGMTGEHVYLVLELVRGTSARGWARRDRGWRAVIDVYRQAGAGLAAAHAAGLVHRDLKPDNILVADDGRAWITDFGLATAGVIHAGAVTLTAHGGLIGTPAYMAPEQLRGERADPASDQFGFCTALWEALYGVRPFDSDSVAELAVAIAMGAPKIPAGIAVPRAVHRVIARGLAADRARRWPDMAALLDALDAAVLRSRRRGWIAPAVTCAMIAAAAAAWLGRADRATQTPELVAVDAGSVGPDATRPAEEIAHGERRTPPARDEAPDAPTTSSTPHPTTPVAPVPPKPSPARPGPPLDPAKVLAAAAGRERAQAALDDFDGAGCQAALDAVRATGVTKPHDEWLVAKCDAVAGQCEAGKRRAAAYIAMSEGRQPADARRRANDDISPLCSPTDAGTLHEKVFRLMLRLGVSMRRNDRAGCHAMRELGRQLARRLVDQGRKGDAASLLSMFATCFLTAADCEAAAQTMQEIEGIGPFEGASEIEAWARWPATFAEAARVTHCPAFPRAK